MSKFDDLYALDDEDWDKVIFFSSTPQIARSDGKYSVGQ